MSPSIPSSIHPFIHPSSVSLSVLINHRCCLCHHGNWTCRTGLSGLHHNTSGCRATLKTHRPEPPPPPCTPSRRRAKPTKPHTSDSLRKRRPAKRHGDVLRCGRQLGEMKERRAEHLLGGGLEVLLPVHRAAGHGPAGAAQSGSSSQQMMEGGDVKLLSRGRRWCRRCRRRRRKERRRRCWSREKEEVVEEVLQATHRGLGLLDLLDLPPGRRHRAGGLRGETGGVVKTLLGVKARLHHHPPPPLAVSRRCSTLGLFFL